MRLRILEKLLSRHPHLKSFADSDELDVFQVNAQSVELLEGVSNAYF
jgi:hypothetical protein